MLAQGLQIHTFSLLGRYSYTPINNLKNPYLKKYRQTILIVTTCSLLKTSPYIQPKI